MRRSRKVAECEPCYEDGPQKNDGERHDQVKSRAAEDGSKGANLHVFQKTSSQKSIDPVLPLPSIFRKKSNRTVGIYSPPSTHPLGDREPSGRFRRPSAPELITSSNEHRFLRCASGESSVSPNVIESYERASKPAHHQRQNGQQRKDHAPQSGDQHGHATKNPEPENACHNRKSEPAQGRRRGRKFKSSSARFHIKISLKQLPPAKTEDAPSFAQRVLFVSPTNRTPSGVPTPEGKTGSIHQSGGRGNFDAPIPITLAVRHLCARNVYRVPVSFGEVLEVA